MQMSKNVNNDVSKDPPLFVMAGKAGEVISGANEVNMR